MKKKSKQSFSEAANTKPQPKKLNPFEVHFNRRKYDIVGLKSKAERGLPGVSRAKFLKKRKGTLLQEYKFKDKKNMFLDRRIGERNSAMTAEDKILARFTAERMKFHSKKSIYNLGDDEELTHRGQALTEIEKFDDPKSEDEDDEDDNDGKLNAEFVGDAHFGGGMFTKVEGESKSRKDLINQLIAESIKRKAEKQKLRQQNIDLTEKLDTEWKELLPLVTASKKSKMDAETENKSDDKFANYDVLSKKLKFEVRGKPTDRLKSEEEIAKEEKEKLEELERDRLQRMMGETNKKTIKHRSADDMDDGFDLSNEQEIALTYKDGVLNVEGKPIDSDSDDDDDDDKQNGTSNGEPMETNEEEEEEEEEEESDDKDEDETSEESENEKENGDESKNKEENGDESESEEEDESSEDDDSDEDDLSDLKDSEESEDESKPSKPPKPNTKPVEKKKHSNPRATQINDEESEKDATEKAKAVEAARKELPYTFEIPKEYEEFEKLMSKYDSDFQSVIVERMIKCHHPSLKEEFKEDLDILYTFLLQHLQDCSCEDSTKLQCFKILDRLAPWLFDLTQWNPQSAAFGLLEVIKEKYQDYLKNPKCYPSLDTIIFLKLVSILFPTSDFRHVVVTPSLIFMQQMLFQCKVQTSVDLSMGLFITTLILEYCALSKRYAQEAICFLYGVLRLVHPSNSSIPVLLPFDVKNENSFNLIVSDKSRAVKCEKMSINDFININSSEEFKVNSTRLALNLLSQFCDFWSEDSPAILIFEPFIPLLTVNEFSDCLKKDVEETLNKILKFKKFGLTMLTMEKRKPKPLRLYEPSIEEVYCLKKHRPMGQKKAERAKLLHKYKREMKGALREIRRDRSFLAKLKFKETLKSDMERQRKVKEILGSAAEQAGELRKFQKLKKK